MGETWEIKVCGRSQERRIEGVGYLPWSRLARDCSQAVGGFKKRGDKDRTDPNAEKNRHGDGEMKSGLNKP